MVSKKAIAIGVGIGIAGAVGYLIYNVYAQQHNNKPHQNHLLHHRQAEDLVDVLLGLSGVILAKHVFLLLNHVLVIVYGMNV